MHHCADDQYIEIPLLVFCKLFLILSFKMHPGNEALLAKKTPIQPSLGELTGHLPIFTQNAH